MTKMTACLVSALWVGAFFLGYDYAKATFQAEKATLREEYALRVQALEEQYRTKERSNYDALKEAWEERDKALASLRELSVDTQRVRNESDAARRRLSSTSKNPCHIEREQLAKSAELLKRGCELLNRGVDLSAKSAVEKDAVVKIVSEHPYP